MNPSDSVRRPKFLTYRIDEIPRKYATPDQLLQCFHSDDKTYVHVKSFVPSISDIEGGEHTATIQYQNEGRPRLDVAAEDIELDPDFQGFTPLNAPDENVAADIIAVTGLGGHAFGSWVNSRGHMWLRDYLPKDLMNRARILIYGYHSVLQKSHNRSSLRDYSDSFMQDLMGIRSQHGIKDRPIIFIGHSLGGLIVKKALSDLGPDVLSRMPIRSILFFGAPHTGLNIRALQAVVAGHANETLVRDLGENSSVLEDLAQSFEKIAKFIKIYSFVETHDTPVVEQINDELRRRSVREVMVSKNSARVGCPTETVRWVSSDHSEMVKLRKGQGGHYLFIVNILKEALQSAPEKWEGSMLRDTPLFDLPTEHNHWLQDHSLPTTPQRGYGRSATFQLVQSSPNSNTYGTTLEKEPPSVVQENEDSRSTQIESVGMHPASLQDDDTYW
ncbi:hypothetical protein B0I35DRAFT_515832 [Stachybotrys elegans]|uniref:DUF676 domain-containing protein n=1 Tax=Stachybotrys elegans TaxID=80388 RepID=A0A8K0SKB6_9HYPO|nr:hypothetical protein B0I35DRAFT_515832 [Stachybotrys elegans]